MDALDQVAVDKTMIELDGTPNKTKLGANAILAVSLATAQAAADAARPAALQIPRRAQRQGAPRADDEHPQRRRAFRRADRFPGIHDRARRVRRPSPRRSRYGTEIFHALKSVLKDRGLSTAVGDEGGFAPELESRRRRARDHRRGGEESRLQARQGHLHRARCRLVSEFYDARRRRYVFKKSDGSKQTRRGTDRLLPGARRRNSRSSPSRTAAPRTIGPAGRS